MLLGLSIKLIIREIRSGYLTSMLVSLTLAITIVSGISLFTDRLEQALSTQTEEFLGGNLKFESNKNKLRPLLKDLDIEDSKFMEMALFASVNAGEGEKIFKKCAACHSIAQGGSNKIGPALWGVLGRKAGSVVDYKYSKALAAYGKSWSFKEMDGFLLKPKDWIKGTKMSFAGLKNAKERAAVILYMNENTDAPLPLN